MAPPPPSAPGVLSASPPIRQTGMVMGSPPRVVSNATRGGLNAIGARGSKTVTTTAAATAVAVAATATSGQLQPEGIASSPSYGLVVGLGDPVSDILVRLEDDNLASRVFATCGIDEPGGCVPVDTDEDIQQLLSVCAGEWVDGAGIPNVSTDEMMMQETNVAEPTYCPGGSAANVMKGVANLGGEAAFVGMVGRDDVGRKYRELLAAQNVRPVLLEAAAATTGDGNEALNSAQCLSLVEKGGQRTMRTYLGASLRMGAADFPEEEALEGAKLLHIEGYTLYRPELAKAAMRAAKARGAIVSLDMASFEVVRNCRAQLLEILESGLVDLLFANEDEAEELLRFDAKEGELKFEEEEEEEEKEEKEEGGGGGEFRFTRQDADRAMAWMLRYCEVATVSMGPRGCVSSDRKGNRGVAPGVRVPVVDTTGAGDSFTAGFLHAYLSRASLQACASCGCAVGTQVVQVLGAELSAVKWNELKGEVRSIIERIK